MNQTKPFPVREGAGRVEAFFRANPDAWTQNAFARDKDGNSVNLSDPTACKFCLRGYIDKEFLIVARRRSECLFNITEWNDEPGRVVEDVIGLAEELGI